LNNNTAIMNPCSEIGVTNVNLTKPKYINGTPSSAATTGTPYSGVTNISTSSWQPNSTVTIGGRTLTDKELQELVDGITASGSVTKSKTVGAGLAEILNGL
jgi:Flp pilus assembly protein TadG